MGTQATARPHVPATAYGQTTIRWKSASSGSPLASLVRTSIALALAGEVLVWAVPAPGGVVPALLRPATSAQPLMLTGKVTVTAPPPSLAEIPSSLARASAALPGLAGLFTTAQ